ncbi:MAG: ABC transporter ATP-binding protein [Alphaproteobacteria bacterium]|nr:ABC transporter ATP-binding protein [Alphaproteobacteria bacterium]
MKVNQSNISMPKTLLGFYAKNVFGKMRWLIVGIVITKIIVSLDNILWPLYQRWIVAMLEDAPSGVNLIKWCMPTILLILGLDMGLNVFSTLRTWFVDIFRPRSSRAISEVLTDYVHAQSLSFWTGRMAGQIHSRITDIARGVDDIIYDVLNTVMLFIMAIINSIALFSVNKYVAIIFGFIFVLRAVFVWYMRNPIKRTAKNYADINSQLNGKLVDSFSNANTIKLFSGVSREHNYLSPIRTEHIIKKRKSTFWQRVSLQVPLFVWSGMFVLTILLCVYLYSKNQMTVADVVYAISVYITVVGSIGAIMDVIPSIIEGLAAANRAYSDLIVPIEVMDKPNAKALMVPHAKIELKNVSFKYKNKYVLRDLTLTIKAGERVGIVGPSGAGKTTLVNLLMRFYDVKRGSILIDGTDIRDCTQESLRENISFIPQDPAMFNRTIRENIAYGRPNATLAEIKNAARFASADKFINGTEKKYDTLVGDRGIKMSGGQRQRIAIARAFLKDAPILILDEATSALDSETEVAIQKSFEKLSHNRTTIAIAHRLSTLRNMDRIVVLDNGRIVESGTHSALLRRRGEYARLWKLQYGGFLQEDKKA